MTNADVARRMLVIAERTLATAPLCAIGAALIVAMAVGVHYWHAAPAAEVRK